MITPLKWTTDGQITGMITPVGWTTDDHSTGMITVNTKSFTSMPKEHTAARPALEYSCCCCY